MTKRPPPRGARDPGPFRADLKCCTYIPFLPNFTLGRLDDGAWERVSASVEKGQAELTPLGLIPLVAAENFGQDEAAKCPFLSADPTAHCTIWRDRPTVCRSYFCLSSNQAFWQEQEERGNDLEWLTAHELLWSLGFTDDEVRTFAEWTGQEREYFRECAKRAGEF